MWNLKSIRSFDSFKNQRLTPHKALLSLTGSIHGPSSTSYLILRDMKRHSVSLPYGNSKTFTTLFPGFSASRPTELRRAGRREPRERGWNFYCYLYSSTVQGRSQYEANRGTRLGKILPNTVDFYFFYQTDNIRRFHTADFVQRTVCSPRL